MVAVQLVTRLTVGGRARRGTGPAGELVGVMGVDGMWTAGELGELVVARAWVMEVRGLKRGVVATATAKLINRSGPEPRTSTVVSSRLNAQDQCLARATSAPAGQQILVVRRQLRSILTTHHFSPKTQENV